MGGKRSAVQHAHRARCRKAATAQRQRQRVETNVVVSLQGIRESKLCLMSEDAVANVARSLASAAAEKKALRPSVKAPLEKPVIQMANVEKVAIQSTVKSAIQKAERIAVQKAEKVTIQKTEKVVIHMDFFEKVAIRKAEKMVTQKAENAPSQGLQASSKCPGCTHWLSCFQCHPSTAIDWGL